MIAHVQFGWCQAMELSALSDGAVVCLMWGGSSVGGTCSPGDRQCGITSGCPQQTSHQQSWHLLWVCSHGATLGAFLVTQVAASRALSFHEMLHYSFCLGGNRAAVATACYHHGCPAQGSCHECPQLVATKPAQLHDQEYLVPAGWACSPMGNVGIRVVSSLQERDDEFPYLSIRQLSPALTLNSAVFFPLSLKK